MLRRIRGAFVSLAALLACVAGSLLWAAEDLRLRDDDPRAAKAGTATSGPGRQLNPIFADDFSLDTRKDYQTTGEITWQPGRLTLAASSILQRELDAGEWVEVELGLQFPQLSTPDTRSETRLRLQMVDEWDSAADCTLIWRQSDVQGKIESELLVATDVDRSAWPLRVVRQWRLPRLEPGKWRITYRWGLIEVRLTSEDGAQAVGSVWAAYQHQHNGYASVRALHLSQAVLPINLQGFTVRATARPAPLGGEERDDAELARVGDHSIQRIFNAFGYASSAVSTVQQDLEVQKRVFGTEHPAYVESLQTLVMVYVCMDEFPKAEPLALEACEVSKRVLGVDHPVYATSLDYLASLYFFMGEYARAEPLLLAACDIRKRTLGNQHIDYAKNLDCLAELYSWTGEYEKAESLALEARDSYRRELDTERPVYAMILSHLGGVYMDMGEYARAQPLLLEARDIIKRNNYDETVYDAVILDMLARLYSRMGEYAKAEQLILESLVTTKQMQGDLHSDYASCLNRLALLYATIGEYAKAEPLLLASCDIWKRTLGYEHPGYAGGLIGLARLYASMGEYAKAEPLSIEARDVLLRAAGKTLPVQSETQAMKWMEENRLPTDLVLASFRHQSKWGGRPAYDSVWRTKSLVTRMRLGQTLSSDTSPQARQVFVQLHDARLRLARMISDAPNREHAKQFQQQFAEASERKEALEKRLAALNPATKRAIAIRDAEVDQLLSLLPPRVAVIDLVQLPDLQPTLEQLTLKREDGTSETRAVKSLEAKPVYDAFVLRSDRQDPERQVVWVPLGAAAPIDEAVRQWRAERTKQDAGSAPGTGALEVARAAKTTDPAQSLRRLVWDKLEPHLADCHTLILLPDGDLNRLPWAALPGKKPGSFLIEDYALGTAAYGQQLFGLLSEGSLTGDSLLVAGGIDYDHRPEPPVARLLPLAENPELVPTLIAGLRRSPALRGPRVAWGHLAGAEQESKTILETWADRGTAMLLKGTAATEEGLAGALPGARYAHLATHGFFAAPEVKNPFRVNLREQSLFRSELIGTRRGATVAGRNPLLLSGIVMAGANLEPVRNELGLATGEDGILTAEEIVSLDLHRTELVTLSACETGLGDVAAGEGVFGLQRALHQAGVRTVVASLWKVDDDATRALMTEFYRNLWEKKLGKLEALRQAQLAMLNGLIGSGGTRGPSGQTVERKEQLSPSTAARTDPRLWAAWILSGDPWGGGKYEP